MKKRFMNMLLALCMVMSILPRTALALDYDIWVGDTQVTSTNMSGAGWSYDSASNTLTLTNATITKNHTWDEDGFSNTAAIYSNGSLSIELIGNNTVIGEDTSNENSYGIYVKNSSVMSGIGVSISGDGTISAQGGDSISSSYGIYAQNFILIFGGTVTAKSISDSGTTQAVSQNPMANSHNVTASTDASGMPQTSYNPGNFSTYKYLKFEPFPPSAPTGMATSASDITATTATLNGTINANGASTTVTFEYGTSIGYLSPVTASQSPVTGYSSTSVSAPLTGLTPNTTYYYRIKAVNSQGSINGAYISFTTLAAKPTVTDANISISGASGTGGVYKIGDTVTATWNNTSTGDNNSEITGVTMNFSQFGGGSAVAATNSSGTWTAKYVIPSGSIDTVNRNVSVTATNATGSTTTADTTNATVDNIAPTVTNGKISISGATGTDGAFKIGDTVTATWNNTSTGDNNIDTISTVAVNFSAFGGGSSVAATNSSGTWTATYTITSGSINGTNKNVSVIVTDNAGNTTSTPDTTNAMVDSIAPTISAVTRPANGTYKAGDNLDFIINFSENVTVDTGGGTPYFPLTIGSSTKHAVYTNSSGMSALVFRYTVLSGDADADGIACTSPIILNGGIIKDYVGNNATLTFTPPTTTSVLVDTNTVPGAPTIGTATAGDTEATVSFTPPTSDGGAAITGYTVTSSPGGITAFGTSSPIKVTGLTNGTTYTFTVAATNNVGTGVASAASNSVTPQAPAIAPAITKHPSNQSVNPGDTATFSVTASGIEPFSYLWQVDEGGGFASIPSATSSSYTIPSITYAMNGYKYRCKVTNSAGNVYSDQATLTVNQLVSATPEATTTTIAKVSAAQPNVNFTLTNSPVYTNGQTWKVYTAAAGSTLATGVTAANTGNTLTLTHATDVPAGTYYVSVIESGKTESARLGMTVGAYVPATYTVTYKPGTSGTGSEASDSKTHDVALTLKDAIFTREGFTQTGWATSDGGAKAYDLGGSYTANAVTDLYPVWTVRTYTVTYTAGANGTILGLSNQSVSHGEDAHAVTAQSNAGYHFVSWSDNVSTAMRIDKNVSGNLSVTASFAINTYTVTYKPGSNGTGSEASDSKTHDVALTLKDVTFTREGFTQTGWATSDGGAKAYDLGGSYTANAVTDLYPVWTVNAPNTYTVTLPAGTGYTAVAYDSSSSPVTSGGNYSFTVTIASGYHKGVDFSVKTNGTPLTADGSGVYTIGNITQTQTVTVEGVVQDDPAPNTYTVSFDTNGGNILTPSALTTDAAGKLTSLPVPTRSGSYSFSGWFTAASGGTAVTTDTVFNANSTVFAQWTYTDGGSSGGSGSGGSTSMSDSSTVIVTPPAADKPNSPTQGEIKVPGTADGNGNVTVNITDKAVADAFDKALADAKKNGNEANGITVVLRVDTGRKTVSNATVNLPKTVQDAIISKKIVNIAVVVDNPDIRIDMDLATVDEINKQANADVNITATRSDSSKLTGDAKTAVGGRPVFDLKVNYGSGKRVQRFGAGSVLVAIPYTLGENEKADNVKAVYIDDDGKVHWLTSSVYDSVNKVVRFSTNHFSTYGVGYKQTDIIFTDVASHWAKEDIAFVVNRGLFSGTSETTFSPNTAMTRGMFVTVLGRLANADVSTYKQSSFTDVKNDAYDMGYIEWASSNNIVNGIGDRKFAPDQAITREQMAVILYRYAQYKKYDTTQGGMAVREFADYDSISDYALTSLGWMVNTGLMQGSDNYVMPSGSATRAQVATILMRFSQNVAK